MRATSSECPRRENLSNTPANCYNLKGLRIYNVQNPIVENNVINDCENGSAGPLDYQNCTTFKAFNNQNSAGKLLRAYDSVNSKYLIELQDFTEDALLSF